jgi:arabinofuranan 3-O-arabinosyltransferase
VSSRRRSHSLLPAGVALLGFALAFLQRPGKAYFDTRIELSVDPGLFLERVVNVWSSTGDLGHVQGGQFVGYLFPMAPWFALTDWLGVPMWVAQRLWLGLLIALAGWGAVVVMDRLYSRERGLPHLAAALFYMLSPYVVIYASRGSVTLLGYAALPWLIVVAHAGVREPRRWRWPAAIALIATATGGGVNATVLAWVLLGPCVLLIYEVTVLGVRGRAALGFAMRAVLCMAVVSLWWVVPVAIQALHGSDFLGFTEAPGTIWGTTSMSESLRQLGFWVLYLGTGFGQLEPSMDVAATYLFNPVVVIGTFALPLVAVAGFRATWRDPYMPFFALLAVLALLVMYAGFPEGAPVRRALYELYDDAEPLRVLRTTYKATPLLALSLACLAGASLGALRQALAGSRFRVLPVATAVAIAVLCGLPLVAGDAIDDELAYDEVPQYWRDAIADAERATPPDQRIAVLPGELFAVYRWGETNDAIGPAISERPVLVREIVRYADPRASQLLAGVDDIVQQGRAVPGQLGPLLALADVGRVLVPTDGRGVQSGTTAPASVAETLARSAGFDRARAHWGSERSFGPTAGRTGPELTLPDIRAYDPPQHALGMVRVKQRETVVDGDADGVVALAATGELRPTDALLYAGDLARGELRAALGRGATLVMTDSARRRLIAPSRLRTNRGPTLTTADDLSPQMPFYDIFDAHGTDAQTVAEYPGLRYLRAPHSAGLELFPETRPYAAFDGRPETSWIADENLAEDEQYVELALDRPHRADAIRVLPHADEEGRTQAAGVSVDGGPEHVYQLRPGWNTLPLPQGTFRKLRIYARGGSDDDDGERADALAEVEIPGLEINERLRTPVIAADAARGLDLSRNELAVVLERTTADFPYRAGSDRGAPLLGDPVHARDAEPGIVRVIALPVARRFELDGWASVGPAAGDARIDRLAGVPAAWTMRSASRFEGVPGRRASSAFDRDRTTFWAGDTGWGERAWIEIAAPSPFSLRVMHLRPGPPEFPTPALVRVRAGGLDARLHVAASGRVQLPHRVTTRKLRLDVLTTRPARRDQGLAAVGIGELQVPGLRPPVPARSGRLATGCGALRVSGAGRAADARVVGTLAELDAGEPLELRGCDALPLPAGSIELRAPQGLVMRADYLRLRSSAPRPLPMADAGAVVDPGTGFDGERDGVKLDIPEESWLVLAESYSEAWSAECRDSDGQISDLGEPVPVDGFANGWRAPAGCVTARFRFGPQRAAVLAYALSAVGLAAVLALFVVALRRRDPARSIVPPRVARSGPLVRPSFRAALMASLAAGAVSAGLFALRSGPVTAAIVFALLRWGVTVRRLVGLAAVGVVSLPILYLAFPAEDKGGYSFEFTSDTMGAHWAADGVVFLLAGAALIAALVRRRVRPS